MECPKCRRKTEVVDSRKRNGATRRRRWCTNPNCGERFTTLEFRVLDSESLESVMNALEAFRATQRRGAAPVRPTPGRAPVRLKTGQVGSR